MIPEGEEAARRLAPVLAKTKFVRVIASPLGRTVKTAELAGFPGCETSPLLLEVDYGADEGRTREEIQAERPGWDFFLHGPKGGETLDDVAVRARKLLAELAKVDGNVLLFSHGHFTRIFTMIYLDWAPAEGRHFMIAPASLAILDHENRHPAIKLWNYTP